MFGMDGLTSRQTEILNFLCNYRRWNGTAPTYREIAHKFGFKSVRSASDHVSALEKKGYVRRHGGRSRGIELLIPERSNTGNTVLVPLLGDIPAGCPEEKNNQGQGSIEVDRKLLGASADHRLFALSVDGDSMSERGIHEGDWIVADVDATAREGDVVVALIDQRNTLKTLAKQKDIFYLRAENPNHSDWVPLETLLIQGVVKTVLRRMG